MRIELVSSATHPRESRQYYDGLAHCYARFSADSAALGRVDVDRCAGLFFALARERQQILGGVGIHVRSRAGSLPVERALGDHALLRKKLDQHRHVAELSGLWVQDDLRGSGLSLRLMHAAMGALPMLGVMVGVGFSHQHVLPLYGNIGLFPDPELRNFHYPDRRYSSSVLWADALHLTGVSDANRRRILHARETFAKGQKLHFRLERAKPTASVRSTMRPPMYVTADASAGA